MNEIEIFLEKENGEKTITLENEGTLILPNLEDLEVTPTKEQQIFNHKNSDGYNKVIVNPMPETKLQDKEVTPTKETQNIVADNNYDGLNKVTIEPIPDEYIIPDGMLPITENTTYDVRKYARVSANVHPAPTLQDKNVTITENGTQTIAADEGFDGLGNVQVSVQVEGSGGGSQQPYMFLGSVSESTGKSFIKSISGFTHHVSKGTPNMALVFWYARSECTVSDNVTLIYQGSTDYDNDSGVTQTLYVGYMQYDESASVTITQATSGRLGIGIIPLLNSDIPEFVGENSSKLGFSKFDFETDDSLNICLYTQIYINNITTSSKLPHMIYERLGGFAFNESGSHYLRWSSGNSYNKMIQVRCPYKKA